ncbi:hypothetical protein DCC39_13630 [Pueribacillus theae]|uniref:Uncharacterized protein n=1 Tax=Pueribacillus theae TaxID=2171751 RepID=A0A2U1JW81_9BACI|nr:hypothetical protein DCC39_13630 [Pueribacillus theae]
MPLGIATNLIINEQDYIISMAVEEPFVVVAFTEQHFQWFIVHLASPIPDADVQKII